MRVRMSCTCMCAMDDDCVYMNRDIDRAKNDKLCFGDDVDANKSRYYRRGSVRPAGEEKKKEEEPVLCAVRTESVCFRSQPRLSRGLSLFSSDAMDGWILTGGPLVGKGRRHFAVGTFR